MTSNKGKEKPLYSLIAGGVAGAVEGTITYPTEYIKTKLQLQEAAASGAVKVRISSTWIKMLWLEIQGTR